MNLKVQLEQLKSYPQERKEGPPKIQTETEANKSMNCALITSCMNYIKKNTYNNK